MAGLDNAALPEDTSDTQETSGLQAVSAKPVKGKGNLALPTPTGGVGYDPTLLQKMEAMIKQREAEQSGIMSALQDATAWWSGGAAGPSEALRARAEQRAKQQEELFGMQSQLSQARTAQQRADALQKELSGAIGGTGGSAGAFASLPDEQKALYNLALRQGDLAGAQAILSKYAEKKLGATLAPDFQTTQEYQIMVGGKPTTVTMTKGEYLEYKQTGKLPTTLGGGAGAGAPGAGTGNAQAASAAGVPVISGDRDIAKQAELYTASQQPGYKGPPVAKPGESLHQKGMAIDVDTSKLTAEHRKWLADNGYVQTMPKTDPNHWAKLPTPSTAMAPSAPAAAPSAPEVKPIAPLPATLKAPPPLSATTAAPSTPTAPATSAAAPVVAPITSTVSPTLSVKERADELAQQRELEKIRFQTEEKGRATELETKAKDVAGRQAATVEAYKNAPTDLANYKFIDNLVRVNPRAFGVLQHADVMSAIGTVLEGGATIPGQGNVNIRNIDDAVRKAMRGSEESDIIAAQKAARVFSQLQLNAAKVVLKGQGAVSDMERQLVANMTGSTKNSPEAIRDFLAWGRIRSEYDQKVGDAMDRWEEKHPNESFRKFELTPEYKALRNAYAMQVDEFAQKSGSYKPNTAKVAKPAGYDEWKKGQQ